MTNGKHALRQQLHRQRRDRIKLANLGGDPEQGFEQSFAQLAYTYIQDKAPTLLENMVGFQLVERNEDNTKAVGLFGFKLGPQWLYAPVFFLNGDLKGHELLYLKGKDSFVPLKENWINYLMGKKPHILGEPVPQNAQQLGVMQPDIYRLSTPPEHGKFASLRPTVADWARPGVQALARWVTQPPSRLDKFAGLSDRLDLRAVLQQDLRLLQAAQAVCQAYPGVKAAMCALYGGNPVKTAAVALQQREAARPRGVLKQADQIPGGLADRVGDAALPAAQLRMGQTVEREHTANPTVAREIARDHLTEDRQYYTKLRRMEGKAAAKIDWDDHLRKLRARRGESVLGRKQAAADTPPKIQVYADDLISENVKELTESERERLLRDGYLIRDHRNGEEVTRAYNVQLSQTLSNPDDTDVYELLVGQGEFEKCLVVHHPHSDTGREPGCLVVRLDENRKAWELCHQTRLWVRRKTEGKHDTENFQDWLEQQSESTSPVVGGTYLALSRDGQGTAPFQIEENVGDGVYKVYWPYCGSARRPAYLPDVDHATGPIGDHCRCDLVVFNQREGTRFKSFRDKLYIPQEAYLVKLKDPPACKECGKQRDKCTCEYFHDSYESPEAIRPGTLADLQMQIMQKTSELKLWSDGHEVVVNRQRMSQKAALLHLIVDHGFREKTAKALLKEAQLRGVGRFRVKYANPYAAMEGPGMPFFPEQMQYGGPLSVAGGVPAQMPQSDFVEIPELTSGNTDPAIYDPMQNIDPQTMQVAQQAQQSGQKEVFDTTMVAGLLKAVRQDSLVDRYLGDLTKALDRLGRILFLFYWHNEEFTERYGKQDMPELEDTLRNAFEVLGDLVLFLKEKTIEPLGAAGEIDPNIDEAARN